MDPESTGGSRNIIGPVVLTNTQPEVVTRQNALAYRAAGRTNKSRILTDLVELRGGIATMRERCYGPRDVEGR